MHFISNNKQSNIDQYISKLASDGVIPNFIKCINNSVPSFFNFKLKLEELKEIIDSLKNKSFPGPDLINHDLLKLIPNLGLTKLLEVFEIISGKCFPKLWKKYSVTFLETI